MLNVDVIQLQTYSSKLTYNNIALFQKLANFVCFLLKEVETPQRMILRINCLAYGTAIR